MARDMATYIYNIIVCGGQQRVKCCYKVGTHYWVQNISNDQWKPSYFHHNTHMEANICFQMLQSYEQS
jgi:hypothetical protein